MSWRKVNVLKKAKVFEVKTDTPFNLANYTGGCFWGETVIDLGISSVEMGFNTIGLKTQLTPLGGNWYKGEILKIPLVPAGNYNEYTYSTANENNKGELFIGYPKNYGSNIGGMRLAVQTTGCNIETEVTIRFGINTDRNSVVLPIDTVKSNKTVGWYDLKYPPTLVAGTRSYASFEVKNSWAGYVKFFIENYKAGDPVKVNGTLNVLALEV